MSEKRELRIKSIKGLKGGKLVVRRKSLSQLSKESLQKYQASLIDIFDDLPPTIRDSKLFNQDAFRKAVDSLFPKPTKKRRQVYFDRAEVHKVAAELDQQHPNMTVPDIAEHPKIANITTMYSDRTVLKWIREVVTRPRGRPKKKIR